MNAKGIKVNREIRGIDGTAVVYSTDFDVGPPIVHYEEDKVHPV